MSFNDLVSFFTPFVFTGVAIYFSLLLTQINTKVKKREAIYVWLAISLIYVVIPYISVIVDALPYAAFILSTLIMYIIARFYWKLTLNQSVVFSLCYGVVNVVSVVAIGALLAGVFSSPSPSGTL